MTDSLETITRDNYILELFSLVTLTQNIASSD